MIDDVGPELAFSTVYFYLQPRANKLAYFVGFFPAPASMAFGTYNTGMLSFQFAA